MRWHYNGTMRLASCLLLFWLIASPALGGDLRVIDGDTFELRGEIIRLWGVDAVERKQVCTRAAKSYPCGLAARDMLRSLVEGRTVLCERLDTDKYGRTVARCTADGLDLGAGLVASGWALDFERYSMGHYAALERAARDARAGLWSGDFILPRLWRKRLSQ